MLTRRGFLRQSAALGLTTAAAGVQARVPERITAATRRDETILRLGGLGDDFWVTWASDDRQYIAVEDGTAWFNDPPGSYNSSLWAVEGGPHNATFSNVPGYPALLDNTSSRPLSAPRYYPYGTLAVDGRFYQFLPTLNRMSEKPWRWIGAKLIYSPDNGHTWCNQNGSSPVIWEPWEQRSHETMAFFNEPQDAFSLLSFLQMGRDYSLNSDGYVYVYAPNGMTDGTMNQLVMFRVQKARILDRGAYEYYAGRKRTGDAIWSKDINMRGVVHTFPLGWVNSSERPGELVTENWLPSVVYNGPLRVYMMANWGIGIATDGTWFGKPSYFGLWVSDTPWGPWRQIHEETAWTPGNDLVARCYAPQISPKWIAPDGMSFWLVWTDRQTMDPTGEFERMEQEVNRKMERGEMVSHEEFARLISVWKRARPYYGFNTQRVDLTVK